MPILLCLFLFAADLLSPRATGTADEPIFTTYSSMNYIWDGILARVILDLEEDR